MGSTEGDLSREAACVVARQRPARFVKLTSGARQKLNQESWDGGHRGRSGCVDEAGHHVQDQEDQVHRQTDLLQHNQAGPDLNLQLCEEDEPFRNGEL